MGTRLSARRFGMGTRLVALSLALMLVRLRPAAGEPGDIFTVAAPVSSAAGPAATPIADGDSSVSTQTGAFTYSYPLSLPPGRAGAKPSLALSYTSQGPIYGTLAAGWSLSVPTIYEDTSGGRLSGASKQYASSMAGGERLVRVLEAAPGYGVSYRAQHDTTFTRYQLETNPGVGYLWRAFAADGTTYYFGHKDAHTTGCANVSYSFAPLTRTEDAFGNSVDYIWEPGVTGECRIRAITWGQNGRASIGYFAAVEFNYSTTSFTCANVPIGSQTSYRTGAQVVSGASQLDSIKIAAFPPQATTSVTKTPIPPSPEHTRTVSLSYSTDPNQTVSSASKCDAKHGAYRELLSIQESAVSINSPQVTLPKTDFRYGEALPAYHASNALNSLSWAATDPAPLNLGWGYRFSAANEPWPTVEAMMIDIDGDGRIDRLVNEPYTHPSGRLFCRAHVYKNTGNGFQDGGTIAMPTLKWATPTGTTNPYSGGLTANSRTGVIERCALNYQRTAYRNAGAGGGSCNNTATSCGGNGYCTPLGKSGYGTDCANFKGNNGGETFIAWRWYDIDGDRKPDLIGSPIRGGLNSYDFQFGNRAPGTTMNAPAEPAIFGSFPACPPDRFPSQPSYTSDGSGAYTMCNGMYPYFVYRNNGDGTFGGGRTRLQQRAWLLISPPPHDSWGPSPTTILYQPVPLESDSGDSALTAAPIGQDSGTLDIDGDGYPDGVTLGTSSWSVWRNDATGTGQMIPAPFSTSPSSFGAASSYLLSQTERTPSSTPLSVQGLGDMNGDGLLDHWNVGTPGDVMAAVVPNDGTHFAGSWAYLADRAGTDAFTLREEWDQWPPYYVHKGRRADARRALDIDRDGRDDIVRFADNSTTWPTIQFNHGGQFGTATGRLGEFGDPWTPGVGDGGLLHHIVVNDGLSTPHETWEIRSDMIDLDGDGYLESVDFGSNYYPQLSDLAVSSVGTQTHPGRLLYEITNNIGGTTTINYASIHSPTVTYSPGRTLPATQWVVQSTTTSDSWSGITSTTSYQYKNPVFSPSLDGLRTWAFRGFEEVTATGPSGAQIIERFDYTVDYTGRRKTKLVVPAATDSPTPIAGEVRSIEETTWEQRTLFDGLVKTFHATAADRWTCKNGQDEAACRANTDTRVRTVNTLTALVSTTGPDTTKQLMWQVTGSRTQTSATPADGDRASTTTFALAADTWTYRLRPLVTKQQIQQGGAMVTFAKSEHTWDASLRVALTDAVALSDLDAPCSSTSCLFTSREYDMKTGNITKQTDARGNATTYSFDSRALFTAAEDRPLDADDVEYEYDYGTGTKTVTRGPLWAFCAIYYAPYCEPGMVIHNEHRIKVDALGRPLERWKSVNDHPGFYDFRPMLVERYEYKDNIDDGQPTSVVHKAALDDTRWTKDSTEFDGSGRPIRKTTYALGSAPADAITSFGYNNAGLLSTVAVPDPTSNTGAQVTYLYSVDSLGRPTSVRRPDAASVGDRSGVDIAYNGLQTTTTEVVGIAGGNPEITYTIADAFGRTTSVNEVRGPSSTATTTYEYAPNDTVSRIIDPENVVTELVHDAGGRRTAITRGSRTWRYTYDANANVIASTAPCSPSPMCDAAYTTTVQYDELNRPTWRLIAPRDLSVEDRDLFAVNSEYQSYDYGANATGRPTQWRSFGPSAADGNAWSLVEDFQYDPDGHVLTHGQRFRAAGFAELSRDVLHQYTFSGALWTTGYRDYVNGGGQYTQAEYEYDNRGLPSAVWISGDRGVTWPNPPTIETRNVAGLVTQRRTQDLTGSMSSIASNWTYDALGRVLTQAVQSEPGPATIARQDLTYFGNDDPKTMTDSLGSSSHGFTFQYDKRHQLTNVDVATAQGPVLTARYAYGDSGRLAGVVQEHVTALPGGNVVPRDVAYQYSGADPEEVTALVPNDPSVPFGMTYQYDDAGNQTMRCSGTISSNVCSGESLTFLYDGKNQLRRVTKRNAAGTIDGSEEYWYDASGNRNMVLRRDGAGNKTELIWTIEGTESHFDETGTVTKAYSYVSLGTPIARVERTSDTATTIEYQFHGLANNTLAAVDQLTGTVNASFSYTPFGELIEATNAGGETTGVDAHLRRMNDKQIDQLSDLAYYGARYYDRTAIAWTQADPLFRVVPDLAQRSSPRRANLYQFSLSNPLRYLDPDGRNAGNLSDYKSEAEVRNAYAAALEADAHWTFNDASHFSWMTSGHYYGGEIPTSKWARGCGGGPPGSVCVTPEDEEMAALALEELEAISPELAAEVEEVGESIEAPLDRLAKLANDKIFAAEEAVEDAILGEEIGPTLRQLVVRGGECKAKNFMDAVERGKSTLEADGTLSGVSVQSFPGKDVPELVGTWIRNGKVGVTTVEELVEAGAKLSPSGTDYNPYHADVSGLTADGLANLFRNVIANPNK